MSLSWKTIMLCNIKIWYVFSNVEPLFGSILLRSNMQHIPSFTHLWFLKQCIGLSMGQIESIWTLLGTNPPASDGRWRDSTPTVNINWLSRFRVHAKVAKIFKSYQKSAKITQFCKNSPKLLGFGWIWLNLTRSSQDLVESSLILPNLARFLI